MEKLTIKQASERFGLSAARIYKLLGDGKIVGERSQKRGRGAGSWVDADSLTEHIKCRHENQGHGKGGIKIAKEGHYMPVSQAAKNSGYTIRYLHRLAERGSIGTRKSTDSGRRLIDYNDLLRHKNNYPSKAINRY